MSKEIIAEITNKNYQEITENIQSFLTKQLQAASSEGLIFGLSGGIDSAVVAYLCQREMKSKVTALIMPDTKISPKSETEDALKMIDKLGIDYKLIDISLIVNEYSKYLEPNEKAKGNLRARIRANILYYYANSKNYLVVGTSDKSEYLLGYFTKFGDSSADIQPIISLYKLQVRKLAEFLGVPDSIIAKKSGPHLLKDHFAEDEIGVAYEEIDPILYCLIDKKLTIQETSTKTEIPIQTVEKIHSLYKISEHKRITAPKPT